jgi:hypothetical protein
MKTLLTLLRAATVLSLIDVVRADASPFYVPANPVWTDTGLTLNEADRVTITACGCWRWARGQWVGPDGVRDGALDTFLDNGTHGMLIAFVGPDPFQGHRGDPDFFPQSAGYWGVGSNGQFVSPATGRLWLGFNDDALSGATCDNAGYVVAQISIVSVPEPGAFSLAALGGGLGGAGRIRCRFRHHFNRQR